MNKQLAKAKHKSTYHKIKKALGDNRHFKTDTKIFIIAHGVVYPLKNKHYSSILPQKKLLMRQKKSKRLSGKIQNCYKSSCQINLRIKVNSWKYLQKRNQ
jgi:hypothetical protein